MTAVAIILAAAVLGMAALCTYLAIWASRVSGQLGDARELAASRGGEVNLAGEKITEANDATKTALASEKAQEKRGDILETDASKPAADPTTALDELSKLSASAAAGPAGDQGSPKH